MFNREIKATRKVRIKIVSLLIENERKLQLLKSEELKNSILSILQFKDLRTKKLKEKNNKTYKK